MICWTFIRSTAHPGILLLEGWLHWESHLFWHLDIWNQRKCDNMTALSQLILYSSRVLGSSQLVKSMRPFLWSLECWKDLSLLLPDALIRKRLWLYFILQFDRELWVWQRLTDDSWGNADETSSGYNFEHNEPEIAMLCLHKCALYDGIGDTSGKSSTWYLSALSSIDEILLFACVMHSNTEKLQTHQ